MTAHLKQAFIRLTSSVDVDQRQFSRRIEIDGGIRRSCWKIVTTMVRACNALAPWKGPRRIADKFHDWFWGMEMKAVPRRSSPTLDYSDSHCGFFLSAVIFSWIWMIVMATGLCCQHPRIHVKTVHVQPQLQAARSQNIQLHRCSADIWPIAQIRNLLLEHPWGNLQTIGCDMYQPVNLAIEEDGRPVFEIMI